MRLSFQMLLTSVLLVALTGWARAQTGTEVFVPPSGKGEPLVAVSGFSGVAQYRDIAARLATSGFFVVLIDGKDVLYRKGDDFDPQGQARLRSAVIQAIASSGSANAKAALVGFSLGGGGVLQWGISLEDIVSRAVVYYPVVSRPGQDMKKVAAAARVPVLAFAAAQDRYMNCCLVQTMRLLDEEAKRADRAFTLVEFSEAEHAFNLAGAAYRAADAEASWAHMLKFLQGK